MFEPKPPDYDRDWKAIDIYLFDNGQSYAPPRKYHLVADQLEWWPVTLNYLANAQYGLIDKAIDLFTLNGSKIKTPLELKNETAYVAVCPPEPFIKAEYEKYLVRASKSWDKRQSLREHNNLIANTQKRHTPVTTADTTDTETSGVKVLQGNSILQTPEETLMIETILAKKPSEKPNFIVVKSTGNSDKRTSQNNVPIIPSIKYNGDKRSLSQNFPGNKNPSLSQTGPVKKPSKRRESIKLGDAKITPPPDIDPKNTGSVKYSGFRGESSTEGNLPNNKNRNYKSISNRRNSTQPVLSKVNEVINELKKYSTEKEPNAKNLTSLNDNKINATYDKNADSNAERDFSDIYIDVTTLNQFKNYLNAKKSKEISETYGDSSNKTVKNEILNELMQDIIQAREEQGCEISAELSVNNDNKIEIGSKPENIPSKNENTQSREIVNDTSINNSLDLTNNLNNIVSGKQVNVQNILKPISQIAKDKFSENTPNVVNKTGAIFVTDTYANILYQTSKPNSQVTKSTPADVVVTSKNKRKSNSSSNLLPKSDPTLINDKVLSVETNPAKVSQNASNKYEFTYEPTSEITIENFQNNENNSSAVFKAKVETLNGNHLNVQPGTLALASEGTTANFVDKVSGTNTVKRLSVNGQNENVQDNSARSANDGSDRFAKKVSTAVGREDVVNLKLSIDIWNHNSTVNSRPTVASMSHAPFISKQNESKAYIPVESNVIYNATNEENFKDDQKIVFVKYVLRHPKDEKQNSKENPKSNGIDKDFIIILPILQSDHITECCNCQKELKHNGNLQHIRQRASSIRYPVRRCTSCISLLNILAGSENNEVIQGDTSVNQSSNVYKGTNILKEPSSVYQDVNYLPRILSSSNITGDKSPDNRESMCKRKSVAINEELIYKAPNFNASRLSENAYKDPLIVIHNQGTEFLEKTADKAIQTEWCNLVMEARLQEDGHYALFLPSIEMLKQFKLIC